MKPMPCGFVLLLQFMVQIVAYQLHKVPAFGGPWRKIIVVAQGTDCCTNFWHFLWLGNSVLCDKLSRLYALELNKNCIVADCLQE